MMLLSINESKFWELLVCRAKTRIISFFFDTIVHSLSDDFSSASFAFIEVFSSVLFFTTLARSIVSGEGEVTFKNGDNSGFLGRSSWD